MNYKQKRKGKKIFFWERKKDLFAPYFKLNVFNFLNIFVLYFILDEFFIQIVHAN